MTTRQQIINGIELIIQEGLRISSGFTPDAWGETVHSEESGWTRKQVYCHLAATADITPGFLGTIASSEEGKYAGEGFDIGTFNAQQVAARETASTEELMQSFETSYKQVIKAIEEMPAEHFTLKRRFGDFEGEMGDLIQSVLVLHAISHIYISSTRAFV